MKRAIEKGDMDALRRALTPRQEIFCREYITDYNGAAAAIRAGYSQNYADRQAHLLLSHDGVRTYIAHLKTSVEAKAIVINPDWVTQKTVQIVHSSERPADQLRGLELLSKILGMLKDRTEISGPDGEAIRIQEQKIEEDARSLQQLIDALAQKRTFVITDQHER